MKSSCYRGGLGGSKEEKANRAPILSIQRVEGHVWPSPTCNKQKLSRQAFANHALCRQRIPLDAAQNTPWAVAATLLTLALLRAFNSPVRLEGHPVRAHRTFSMRCRKVLYRRERGCLVDGEDGGGVMLAVRCVALRGPSM